MIIGNFYIVVVICIYFFLLLCIGLRGYGRTKTFEDYILGGRKLGPILGAMNVGASDMSSWLLMGLPGAFYLYGLNQIWMIIGLIMGSYASWKLIAPRLRMYTEAANNSMTISSFLENRFNDNTKILRLITAIIILFFFAIYIASGFVGSAKLFSSLFAISYRTALIISVFVIVFYALIGGFVAVSLADVLQGTLMLFTLVMVPIGIVYSMDGISNTISIINIFSPSHFDIFHDMNAIGIISLLAWGLGYFGQPHIISKYMAIKNVSDIKIATRICITWMSISMFAAALVGLFGYAFFIETPLLNYETVFLFTSNAIFHATIMGLVVSAILAAIMSTINGQILICCATLSEDFYKRFFRKSASNKELLIVTRLFIVIVAYITFYIASDENNTVLGLVAYAWSGLGAAIGPVIICSLFVQRTTKLAAIVGVISGATSSIIFSKLELFSYEIFPAFSISLILILVVSYLQKKSIPQDVSDIFEKF